MFLNLKKHYIKTNKNRNEYVTKYYLIDTFIKHHKFSYK